MTRSWLAGRSRVRHSSASKGHVAVVGWAQLPQTAVLTKGVPQRPHTMVGTVVGMMTSSWGWGLVQTNRSWALNRPPVCIPSQGTPTAAVKCPVVRHSSAT